MTLKRKIIIWTLLTILSIPALMIFNDNYDTVYINFAGLAYAYAMYHICKRALPQWMTEYLGDKSETDDKFEE